MVEPLGAIKSLVCPNEEEEEDTTKDEISPQRSAEFWLSGILGEEVDLDEAPLDIIVEDYETLRDLQRTDRYVEGGEGHMCGFFNKHDDSFNAHVRVYGREERGAAVELDSIFYTESEIDNDIVGQFCRRFCYNGPYVRFDIERENPEMRVFTS